MLFWVMLLSPRVKQGMAEVHAQVMGKVCWGSPAPRRWKCGYTSGKSL